ncbi:hypothetical protein A2U01_0107196, partial [Trifolium medium]|nr:hypothetical protein [Trifolium medium]
MRHKALQSLLIIPSRIVVPCHDVSQSSYNASAICALVLAAA